MDQQGNDNFMKVSKPLAVFYCLAALLLALPGAWLLLAPHSFITLVHAPSQAPLPAPMTRELGLSLLLAAAINLTALAGGTTRAPLHAMVLVYLIGLAILHGTPRGAAALWVWLPVLIYTLPLAPWHRLMPDKRRAGEVKWFNPNKGFGFIVADNGDEVFVHFRAVRNGGRRSLRTGTRVRFTTRQSERGEQADQVFLQS